MNDALEDALTKLVNEDGLPDLSDNEREIWEMLKPFFEKCLIALAAKDVEIERLLNLLDRESTEKSSLALAAARQEGLIAKLEAERNTLKEENEHLTLVLARRE